MYWDCVAASLAGGSLFAAVYCLIIEQKKWQVIFDTVWVMVCMFVVFIAPLFGGIYAILKNIY
jgi:hypothetical protein